MAYDNEYILLLSRNELLLLSSRHDKWHLCLRKFVELGIGDLGWGQTDSK